MASASLTLFLNPLMAFPSPSPNCGIFPAPKMIKTMTKISISSIHPNDPNITHSLSLLFHQNPTHPLASNDPTGRVLHWGESVKAIEEYELSQAEKFAIGPLDLSESSWLDEAVKVIHRARRCGQSNHK